MSTAAKPSAQVTDAIPVDRLIVLKLWPEAARRSTTASSTTI